MTKYTSELFERMLGRSRTKKMQTVDDIRQVDTSDRFYSCLDKIANYTKTVKEAKDP